LPDIYPVFTANIKFGLLNLAASTTAPTLTAVNPASGPLGGGDTITISGTNFTVDSMVSFDGIDAGAVFVDAETLTCIAPAHAAGTVDVKVVNPDGQSATLMGAYSYQGAAPVISQVSPGSGLPAGGESITIMGANFANGVTVTFGGTGAGAVFISSTTISCTAPPHAVGTVSVRVTNPDGQFTSALYTYDGGAPPVDVQPSAGFHANPLSGSAPLLVSFTDESIGTITGRLWKFGDGSTSSDKNPEHEYTTAGIYTVELTAFGPGGSNTFTRTDYITVHELLTAGFLAEPSTGNAPLDVSFTDTSRGDIETWEWDFDDGETSSVQNPIHRFVASGTYHVMLRITNTDGSDDVIIEDVVVSQGPAIPTADFSTNPLSGPAPLTVSFEDLSIGEDLSYDWDFGDGTSTDIQNPNHGYTAPGSYTVTLTVSNSAGSDMRIREDYITVTQAANTAPDAPNLVSPGDGMSDISLMPPLQSGPFNDPDSGDTLQSTEIQISTVSDFSVMILNYVTRTGSTTFTVPEFILNGGAEYFWRERFTDSGFAVSPWSVPFSFFTLTGTPYDDLDGEVDDPLSYFPDATGDNFLFVKSAVGNAVIALEGVSNVASLVSLKAIHPDDIPVSSGIQTPYGFISFILKCENPGDTVDVRVQFSEDISPDARWYHYDQILGQFNQFPATFSNNRSVTLQITDGGDGDVDNLPNGWIIDPAGYGVIEGECEAVAIFSASLDPTANPMAAAINASASVGALSIDFGDGNMMKNVDSNSTLLHTYVQPGTYTMTLTATGPDGCTTTATRTITINGGTSGSESDDNCFISVTGDAYNTFTSGQLMFFTFLSLIAAALCFRKAKK